MDEKEKNKLIREKLTESINQIETDFIFGKEIKRQKANREKIKKGKPDNPTAASVPPHWLWFVIYAVITYMLSEALGCRDVEIMEQMIEDGNWYYQ